MASGTIAPVYTVSDFNRKFQGFAKVRIADRNANIKNITNWWEVPCLLDSVNFSAADPTINESKIYGSQVPWTSSATPGEITVAITIPALDDMLIEMGWTKIDVTDTLIDPAAYSQKGVAGTWSFKGADMTMKVVEKAIWLISEEGDFSMVWKNFRGYAQLVMDNNAPVGIKLNGRFTTPVAGDTEGDVLFGTFSAN